MIDGGTYFIQSMSQPREDIACLQGTLADVRPRELCGVWMSMRFRDSLQVRQNGLRLPRGADFDWAASFDKNIPHE